MDAGRKLRRRPFSDSQPGSKRKRRAAAFSYKEASSSEDAYESDSPAPVPTPKKRRTVIQKVVQTPTRRRQQSPGQRRKTEPILKLPQRQRATAATNSVIPSDGVTPAWQALPYEILLSIFQHALHPAHDDNLRPNPLINWLLRASRVCKSFTEPALSALYESPPMLYADQPHGLLDLLNNDYQYINYKSKIRRIELDSKRTLAYSLPGRGHMDILALISQLPNLSCVDISDSLDRPPYRLTTQKGRWYYPDSLSSTLQEHGIRLKEWRWGRQMMGKSFPGIRQVHGSLPFRTLQHLSLSNLWLASDAADTEEYTMPNNCVYCIGAGDLSSLGDLQSLSLQSCDSGTWDILSRLPNDLTSLSVVNCPTFTSTILDPFLVEHGRKLKTLTLNHNHALDMSWLVDLKAYCPVLEILRMDLTYFSSALLTQNTDSEPIFETLLIPGNAPTWPSTLREIEMLHLRKWSSEAAVTFFESLVNSSGQLPVLKNLTIKAMLNIGWRDRAGFREKWISQLRSTFLRTAPPPSTHLASFRAYKTWREALERQETERKEKESSSVAESDRRVTRSAQNEESNDSHETPESKGTCEIVDISIDNMRPTETRLTEADFIDSEISGDEDWTGERSSPRVSYAW